MSEVKIEMGMGVEQSRREMNDLDLLNENQKKHRESWDKVPNDVEVLDEELREYKEEVIGTSEEELGNTVSEEYLRELWNRREREVEAEEEEENSDSPDYWALNLKNGLKIELENGNEIYIKDDELERMAMVGDDEEFNNPKGTFLIMPDSKIGRWAQVGFGKNGEEDLNGGLLYKDGEIHIKIPRDDRFELFGQTIKLTSKALNIYRNGNRYIPIDTVVSIAEVYGK